MDKDNKPKPMVWPRPKDPDTELDEALRDLGEELLDREIPERLVRVLRAAKDAGKKGKQEES